MEQLKCPACQQDYTEANPPRLLTMCGHTYCQECLKSMISRKEYRFQIRCLQCKIKMNIDSSTTSQFPRNMVLIETINKKKPIVTVPQDKNEFLPEKYSEITGEHKARISKCSFGGSAFGSKRNSIEEGMCLLHQKHLDIICLEEKISICAECALFGLHKGHQFTTIRDLEIKRDCWVNQIAEITEEKSRIQGKSNLGHIQKNIQVLISKRKETLKNQLAQHFNRLKRDMERKQQQLIEIIEQSLSQISFELNKKVNAKSEVQQMFKQWELRILRTIQQLQSMDVIKSIDVLRNIILNNKNNLISQGKQIIQKRNKEIESLWNKIETFLNYPKIIFSSSIQQTFSNIARIQKFPNIQQAKLVLESEQTKQQQFCQLGLSSNITCSKIEKDQFSLLEEKEELSFSTIIPQNRSSLVEQFNKPRFEKVSQTSEVVPRTFKKAKTKGGLVYNKSLVNLKENRSSLVSQGSKDVTKFLSRELIQSPNPFSNKDKLSKYTFRVKDPQKYERLIKSMESNVVDSLDFTGLEMGNDITKQVLGRIKQSKRIRTLRLTKNKLTDQCLPFLLQCLPGLESINLAQNGFTSNTLQVLMEFVQKNRLQKSKSVQLGQNNINPRKHKARIEELSKYGIQLSL